MMSLIFDGILLYPKQNINITDIENYLYNKSGINMKISIKPFDDHYPRFGESNIDINEFKKKYRNKCYINKEVIHHNYMLKENNIIDYICNDCNLKIKNSKELIVLFHNLKGYDNSYMIDIFSKIPNIRINYLAQNQERFKMLTLRLTDKKHNIKIIDRLSFLQSKLDKLSKDLPDSLKSVTKKYFKNKFELFNRKMENFPYMHVNPNNLDEKCLPKKKYVNNILTMQKITKKQYKQVKLFYEKMNFRNLREYLYCYRTSDITLSANVFNNFRKMIFDQFELDAVKYVSKSFT